MAVMATESEAFEQKSLPVASSDTMALDVEINGLDNAPKTIEISPANESVLSAGDTNGNVVYAQNQTIVAPIDPPTEESSLSIASQLASTNATSFEQPPTSSPEVQQPSLSASDAREPEQAPATASVVETAISSALEDVAATSTVPPLVEAEESDVRDETSVAEAQDSAIATEPTHTADLQTEPTQIAEPQPESTHTLDPQTEPPPIADLAPVPKMDGQGDSRNSLLENGVTDHAATSSDAPPVSGFAPPPPFEIEQPVAKDEEMTDAADSAVFTKVSREREDDNEEEPSAKRTKTEEDITMEDFTAEEPQVASEVPATADVPAAVQNDEATPAKSESTTTITPYEFKEIIKVLKNVVRTTGGKNFRLPVKDLWPNFASDYYAKISHPVDLATMETNLKDGKYPTMDDFKNEVNLIYNNAVMFNGEGHVVALSGKAVRDSILEKMSKIPSEPPVVPKAAKKQTRKSTPLADAGPRAPRRQSKSGGAAPTAGGTQTFALDPNTSTPLIRRDSTKGDGGRPKREIHPPKNKDMPYNTTTRPKNKKVAQELRFCEEVLAELKKQKHAIYADAFMTPVDPVSLNIPNYFQIIKHPMDISTIEVKLKSGEYQGSKPFESDFKLMFANCFKFNPPSNVVYQWGKQLEQVFVDTWANKSKWFAEHAPAAETPSSNGGSDDEESDEEAEVEEEESTASTLAFLSERLTEEQDKLIKVMANPKKNADVLAMQQDMVDMIKKKIADAKAKVVTKKGVKKAKPAKPAKKQAPAKKAGAAATKKGGSRPRKQYMGTHEKNVISLGIQRLPEDIIKEILAMIKAETDVDEGDDGEVELDIDVVSTESLWKIHSYVIRYVPGIDQEARAMLQDDKEDEAPAKLAKPPAKKKNKPMSKSEQERKIEQLAGTLENFQRNASDSQEPLPTVERQQITPGDESSGDEASDSEED